MLRKISTVCLSGLLLLGLLPPAASAARARRDTKPPKIMKAEMLDRNGNGLADAVRLTYNEKIKHRLDTDGRYPFKVKGPSKATSYRIKKVNGARRSKRLLIILKEKQNGDPTPDVKYIRTRKKPVKDLAKNQAKRQIFIRTLGLPVSTDTFMLTVTPPENGTITSSPSGINCGSDCSQAYPAEDQITLTATPDEGAEWTEWGGACSGAATTCVVTMDSDKTVSGSFLGAGERLLTVEKTGAGKVTSDPSGIDCGSTCTKAFTQDQDVTLTATPDLNSEFLGWTGATDCAETTTCTVTMDESKTVQAEFTWVLTVIKTGSGSVSSLPAGMSCAADITTCAAGFEPGTNVVLSASPSSGSKFVGWTEACTGTTAVAGCSVTMDANKTVKAGFGYDLTVTKDAAGTGDGTVTSSSNPAQAEQLNCGGTCTVTFPSGTIVTLTAAAATDNVFAGWSGACSGTSTTCQVTVDAAKSVVGKFDIPAPKNLAVTKNGNGVGTVTSDPPGLDCTDLLVSCGTVAFAQNTPVTLTATPGPGMDFGGWGGDCLSAGTNVTCELVMNEDKEVSATFNLDAGPPGDLHTLEVTREGAGSGTVTSVPAGISCGVDCSESYDADTIVVLTATHSNPVTGVVTWGDGCTSTTPSVGGVSTCTVTMDAAKSITATFS